jgi:hypothetical protein
MAFGRYRPLAMRTFLLGRLTEDRTREGDALHDGDPDCHGECPENPERIVRENRDCGVDESGFEAFSQAANELYRSLVVPESLSFFDECRECQECSP